VITYLAFCLWVAWAYLFLSHTAAKYQVHSSMFVRFHAAFIGWNNAVEDYPISIAIAEPLWKFSNSRVAPV
jgi:hypothetical protein